MWDFGDCLAFGVAECDLTPDGFWSLSWFEWTVYLYKYQRKIKFEKSLQEAEWERFRIGWSVWMNGLFSLKKKVRPKDLITLSFDKREKSPLKETDTEMFERIKNKYGATLNGK